MDDDEPPPVPEPSDPTDWTPFTTLSQFKTAEFLFKQAQMSAGNIDDLLTLWAAEAAASGGEPPFVNHAHLYSTIDAIPVGGIPWQLVMCWLGLAWKPWLWPGFTGPVA